MNECAGCAHEVYRRFNRDCRNLTEWHITRLSSGRIVCFFDKEHGKRCDLYNNERTDK